MSEKIIADDSKPDFEEQCKRFAKQLYEDFKNKNIKKIYMKWENEHEYPLLYRIYVKLVIFKFQLDLSRRFGMKRKELFGRIKDGKTTAIVNR